MLDGDIVNYDIKAVSEWTTVVGQLLNTLFLIGLVGLFFYIIFKILKSLKRISIIESKVYKIEETLKRIEKDINKY